VTKQSDILVSILHWNDNGATNRCINTISRLANGKPDIVIIDNGSDQPYVLPDKYKGALNILLIREESNKGFTGGHNIAINYAYKNKYKYVLLLNNDTLLTDNNLLKALKSDLKLHSDAIAVAPKIVRKDGSIWFGGSVFNKHSGFTKHIEDESIKELKEMYFLSGCCLFIAIDKTTKNKVLFDDHYFAYWEDTDWCIRQQNDGFRLLYDPTVKIVHDVSGSLGIANPMYIYYVIRNHFLYVSKNIKSLNRLSAYSRILIEILKYFRMAAVHRNGRFKALVFAILDGIKGKNGKLVRKL
jgi:hypothetical protein